MNQGMHRVRYRGAYLLGGWAGLGFRSLEMWGLVGFKRFAAFRF